MNETEKANAYIQKNVKVAQNLQASGLEVEKFWSTAGNTKHKDCELCKRNEKAGWIPLNNPFPSGHQYPLAHDGCRCDILTRVKKDTKSSPKKSAIASQAKKKSGCGAPAAAMLLIFIIATYLLATHLL